MNGGTIRTITFLQERHPMRYYMELCLQFTFLIPLKTHQWMLWIIIRLEFAPINITGIVKVGHLVTNPYLTELIQPLLHSNTQNKKLMLHIT